MREKNLHGQDRPFFSISVKPEIWDILIVSKTDAKYPESEFEFPVLTLGYQSPELKPS